MNEAELIGRSTSPSTPRTLEHDLRAPGVSGGDVLVVHTSSRAVGWVAGGAAAIVDALLAAVGPEGTVTMPAHSGDWGDPSGWQNPPVPSAWWADIIEDRPAFDPYSTPLREMGAVAENLLMRRATVRSGHPLNSHMAYGRHAATIVQHHPLHDSFGDESPLGRLYELGAKVLLIGVGHGNNTSLHLAEARAQWPGKERVEFMSKVMTAHGPQQVTWLADDADGDDFELLGEHLDSAGLVTFGKVGQATTRLADMRALVDRAVPWFEANRR